MAPNTTKTGIGVLDKAFGGVYLHLPTVVCGRRKSGKFVFATQLLVKTLRAGERIILFTSKRPQDVIANVRREYPDIDEAASSGQLVICPYSSMHHANTDPYAPLPFPEALDELTSLVRSNGISYAIFDSVVPWTAIEPVDAMPEHVDTFFSTLSMLGLTSLLILPEPASAAALSLTTVLRELCPINIELEARNFGANFIFRVTKFQGMAKAHLPMEFSLDIVPGVGFETLGSTEGSKLVDLYTPTAADQPVKTAAPAFRPLLVPTLASFSFANESAPSAPAAAPAPAAPPMPAAPPEPETPSMPTMGTTIKGWAYKAVSGHELADFASLPQPTDSKQVSADSAPLPKPPAPAQESADFAPLPQPPASVSDVPVSPLPEAAPVKHTSFANVIDLPEFPEAREVPELEPPQNPRRMGAHSFSQVIN